MNNLQGARPNNNIKLVYLKTVPNKRSNDMLHQIRQDLRHKITGSTLSNTQKHYNSNSVALLSSIIQDERTDAPIIKHQPSDQFMYPNSQQKAWTVLCNKMNTRHLSTMIRSDSKVTTKALRSKTQGIDRLLGQNKLMPINQLKHGFKNIGFSIKNKKDLNKDFKIFLQNKDDQPIAEKPINFNTVYSTNIRFYKNQKYKKGNTAKIRNHYRTRCTQNKSKQDGLCQHQAKKDVFQQKNRDRDYETNYGTLYKQLKMGFPHFRHKFQWSKLNEQQSNYILY